MDEEKNMIKVAIIDDDIKWIKLIVQYLNGQNNIMVSWSSTNKEEYRSLWSITTKHRLLQSLMNLSNI